MNQPNITDYLAQISSMDTNSLQLALATLKDELDRRLDCDCAYIIWILEDIQGRRPDLTDGQCREVLRELDRHHDAEIGINWDVIDARAENLYPEPDDLDELREQYEY